ncbi:DNA cytosine methyltransferase [Streptomyces sp. TRM66268-LWL]|uniref:DNA (cytosine-5-)-methyltransferase n=1 Tax=Streptomyces polyasparticus TaxID=2767826 RepID=A0ABR7SVI2_9ACTN|nr:DNA cytosine methyltransferase [Streptomyces polyasparticus]MBC9719403.1 DNA cytosine methyltransferase [Streptomyces polyasparticus]
MASAEVAIGSLFSGVGELDLGVQSVLDGRVAWHCENDPRAASVLARHWPTTPNLGDIREGDFDRVEPVDVLTAGFPCQDLSLAGPRTGLSGPRSGLWQHTARAIRSLRPSLVVVENVPGLLSIRAGSGTGEDDEAGSLESCPTCLGEWTGQPRMRALGVVLSELAGFGYDAGWVCVRASDVGAPHRRFRVFLAAWPATDAPPRGRPPAAHPHGGRCRGRAGYQPQAKGRYEPAHRGQSPAHWWGGYLPAVRRWEHLTGQAAPRPTAPGTRRLSAEFVEWMMLPAGWVTGTPGLSRAAQLHLIGNSVVPQQAAHALDLLLTDWVPPHILPERRRDARAEGGAW